MNCRHCGAALTTPFLDLGIAPPSNAYSAKEQLAAPEVCYPLRLLVCHECWLVQTEDYAGREALFTEDYAYFSSVSSSWLSHSERYVEQVVERFGLGRESMVVEIASNDGYLLQFVQARGIGCYGIEPTRSTAAAAEAKGLDVLCDFFGAELARALAAKGRSADLMVANNVLAHVPNINDFVAGFTQLLKQTGVCSFEFPHLLVMVREGLFDTVYHEHYSYLSLSAVSAIFERNGLQVFDVEMLPTHGGSLRVFAQRLEGGTQPVTPAVARLLAEEEEAGVRSVDFYRGMQRVAERAKDDMLMFLIDAKREGRRVAAYGAAAKGNTLLNFAGVKPDLLAFVCDAAPSKQGKFLPGSRIPVVSPEVLRQERPDYVAILPWNLSAEIRDQLRDLTESRFVTFVPRLRVE